eukprot:6273784-Prymnesium_polylepis.1
MPTRMMTPSQHHRSGSPTSFQLARFHRTPVKCAPTHPPRAQLANLDAELDNYATSNWMLRARIWSNSAAELYVISMCTPPPPPLARHLSPHPSLLTLARLFPTPIPPSSLLRSTSSLCTDVSLVRLFASPVFSPRPPHPSQRSLSRSSRASPP